MSHLSASKMSWNWEQIYKKKSSVTNSRIVTGPIGPQLLTQKAYGIWKASLFGLLSHPLSMLLWIWEADLCGCYLTFLSPGFLLGLANGKSQQEMREEEKKEIVVYSLWAPHLVTLD